MPTALCQGYKEAMVEFEIVPARANAIDITGQKFNRLMAIAPTNLRQSDKVIWLCRCSCGKEKLIRGDSLIRGNTKSCGCLKRERWENYPNHGDVSRKSRLDELEYVRWRKAVFARDRYSCRKCDSMDNLICHHVFNFAQHESLRIDVDNGNTMCLHCHGIFHGRYGYVDNTPEQLIEFLLFKENNNASSTM